jgi:predicted GIY-YIG superfamily endonuclease
MNTLPTPVNTPVEYLYRLRDQQGELLYVGITRDWPTRMKQHQADKPWWSDVANVELLRVLGTRQQIEAIEKAVIRAETPTYNKVHNAEVRVQLGARAINPNPLREQRHGSSKNLTPTQRREIIHQFSDYGPEWHHWSLDGYDVGWIVEHPEFGEGHVVHCDEDLTHGDVRVSFFDDPLPYRCLSIHWAPLKTVAK